MLKDLIKKKSDEILSWKSKYGDIYFLEIEGKEYIFRTLTRGECRDIFSIQEKVGSDSTDIILEKCLLYPVYDSMRFDDMLAGSVEYLLKTIIDLSGFSKTERFLSDLEKERNKIDALDTQIVLLICKAFPHLKPEDINNFNYQQLLQYIALAESILEIKLSIDKQDANDKIDFEKENKDLGGVPGPFQNINKRGDVAK
jgi:hypothetical protein